MSLHLEVAPRKSRPTEVELAEEDFNLHLERTPIKSEVPEAAAGQFDLPLESAPRKSRASEANGTPSSSFPTWAVGVIVVGALVVVAGIPSARAHFCAQFGIVVMGIPSARRSSVSGASNVS